jgi:hypothetical protein
MRTTQFTFDTTSTKSLLPEAAPACEICHANPASLFIGVTQDYIVAKAHACWWCFEHIQTDWPEVEVESVSQQDFNQVEETT